VVGVSETDCGLVPSKLRSTGVMVAPPAAATCPPKFAPWNVKDEHTSTSAALIGVSGIPIPSPGHSTAGTESLPCHWRLVLGLVYHAQHAHVDILGKGARVEVKSAAADRGQMLTSTPMLNPRPPEKVSL
jgi:hypothetical protein